MGIRGLLRPILAGFWNLIDFDVYNKHENTTDTFHARTHARIRSGVRPHIDVKLAGASSQFDVTLARSRAKCSHAAAAADDGGGGDGDGSVDDNDDGQLHTFYTWHTQKNHTQPEHKRLLRRRSMLSFRVSSAEIKCTCRRLRQTPWTHRTTNRTAAYDRRLAASPMDIPHCTVAEHIPSIALNIYTHIERHCFGAVATATVAVSSNSLVSHNFEYITAGHFASSQRCCCCC